MEMRKFAQYFYGGVKDATFFESCGIADLITTCSGGRNRKVAEARVITGKSFDILEAEMLGGQKLQGGLTAKEVNKILKNKRLEKEYIYFNFRYPLFTAVYRICYEGLDPKAIVTEI